MRVLTADEMRRVDLRAIDEIGIPSMVLMENAAIGIADALAEVFPKAESAAIFCGPGNNGGDGLALARLLDARGYRVRTFLVLRSSEPKGDAAAQLRILENAAFDVERLLPDSDLLEAELACAQADLVVDALFGTGLTRPLQEHFADLVAIFNRSPTPCLAVDLPSGLDGSRGETTGPYAPADLTVTFAAPKVAHILAPAAEAMGTLVVTDLGIPPFLVDEAPGELHVLTEEEMAASLLPRATAGHKGTFGHTLLVGGSVGKAGAMVLAATAAVRSGSGLVTVAVPDPLANVVDGGSLESMTLPMPGEVLDQDNVGHVLENAADKDAVGLGPGLGLDPSTVGAVRRLVLEIPVPLVLDADGLNAFAGDLAALAQRQGPTILTPHPGEMARLLGITSAEVQSDRLGVARRAAAESGAIVILKGQGTVIAGPTGELWINPTGNDGMATGGSGDVLTGLVAGLLAQGYDMMIAAQLGAYLHGLAGDLVVGDAPEALRAGDLVEALPAAFAQVRAA